MSSSLIPSQPNRQELDPPPPAAIDSQPPPPLGPPPEKPAHRRADDPDIAQQLESLINAVGGKEGSFNARLVHDLLTTCLKLIPDGRDTGELKLITSAVKELRHAFRVFGQYPEPHKVTIFGSARTTADHPDYAATVAFSKLMAQAGWMVITGAGGGIMEAGHIGPGRTRSFGVAIRLPFETSANEVIIGDEKLIYFRYFFTRKLVFLSQAEAVALFPGGFGTMDEAFEVLTLVQTGKASMIPVVMCQGPGIDYWHRFDQWIRTTLLARGLISPEDLNLYHIAPTPEDAAEHVQRFYRNYHSSRYVNDDLVIRLRRPLHQADVDRLAEEFAVLVKPAGAGNGNGTGRIVQRGPYPVETDHLELPRLAFTHTRRNFGLIRVLIDRVNRLETE
jgi:hypothetical protein